MAITNGDIKQLSTFAFRKWSGLMDWWNKKHPMSPSEENNARQLLGGLHIVKMSDGSIWMAVFWENGRTRVEPWIATNDNFIKDVTAFAKKSGIKPYDLANNFLNEFQLTASMKRSSSVGKELTLERYKYIKNPMKSKLAETINSDIEIGQIITKLLENEI